MNCSITAAKSIFRINILAPHSCLALQTDFDVMDDADRRTVDQDQQSRHGQALP